MTTSKDNARITAKQLVRIRELLSQIPADSLVVRLHVGAAICSEIDNAASFKVWDAWSKQASTGYDAATQQSVWDSFVGVDGHPLGVLLYYRQGGEFPAHENEAIEYARHVLADRLKIAGTTFYTLTELGHWSAERISAVRALLAIINGLLDVALRAGSKDAAKVLRTLAGFKKAEGMLDGLRAFAEFDAKESDFDAKPELLGVQNGVVDLRTGEFRAARAGDMVSRSTAVPYDENAQCPGFERFLRQVAPSQEYRDYLQNVIGYTLVGHGDEQKAFFLLGSVDGRNGKGTFMRAIRDVLSPDYCVDLSSKFMKSAGQGNINDPTPALMTLQGVRAALCAELKQTNGLDEEFFKTWTGGDYLTGVRRRGDQVAFKPQAKLLISMNGLPDWNYEKGALWERIVILPFFQRFTGAKIDISLGDELKAEAPGILQWMIEGAMWYLRDGLGECDEVTSATEEARPVADTIGMWIDSKCQRGAGLRIPAGEAYKEYKAFIGGKRLDALDQRRFKARMIDLGYKRSPRQGQGYFYLGLDFKQ
ncbi:phage/plasmid primase, P4 family [Paraburkholderia fungorum]|uniref:phage/plasmid primase, P4 family n=1 Tax=Paraburkholderia fungorum TaxID=134537 RepID=UPI0038B7A428